MSLIYAILSAVVQGIAKTLFGGKTTEQKAVDTIIAEREEALDKVKEANKAADRFRTDPDYRDVLYEHYRRKDD